VKTSRDSATGGDEPFDIKDGTDGWLWFTNKSGNSLGRIFSGHPEPL